MGEVYQNTQITLKYKKKMIEGWGYIQDKVEM